MEDDPTSVSPVSVVLADSNRLIMTAMAEVFDEDQRFSLVATSATAEGFLQTVRRIPVQIGVIDWTLPTLGGAKLIEAVNALEPAPRMVVYGDDVADMPRRAMMAGAAGFSPRNDRVEDLLDTCESVAAGQMVFPFLDVGDLQRDPLEQLSKAQRRMLKALSTGKTNRELATELGISTSTVKFHLSNLYDKLAVKNRSQAIAFFYSIDRKFQDR